MKEPKRYRCVRSLTLSLILASAGLLPAFAEEPDPAPESPFVQFMKRDYLLGDWGGVRTTLSQHGLDFEFLYGASLPNNLSGGFRHGTRYQGALLMDFSVDTEKLMGWDGGTFNVSSLWLHGEKPFSTYADGSPAFSGDLNKVNLLDFPNALRLWELWYQQRFLDDKLAFKFGELSIDRDFVVPELYNSLGSLTLLNQTFFYPTLLFDVYDVPGLPARNHGLPATPNAVPGAVLRFNALPEVYAQAGVYGGNPDQSDSGTKFPLSEREGALAYFEAGWHFNQGTNDIGLEGSYKLGAFYHTGDFVDMYEGVTAAFLETAGIPAPPASDHKGDYGIYFLAEQQLYREAVGPDPVKQGLVGFFRVAAAPADRNLTQLGIDGGLVYKGLIPRRDWDTLALGLSYLEMSQDIRKAQQDANDLASLFGAPSPFPALADYEGVIELSYKAQIAAWATLQLSVQQVLHPGGSRALPDATVLILQSTVRF